MLVTMNQPVKKSATSLPQAESTRTATQSHQYSTLKAVKKIIQLFDGVYKD